MREIKLLLSAKLCAVTVFAWLVSLSNHKNSASAFTPQLSLLHICDPAGVGGSSNNEGIYTKKATSNEVAFSNSVMNYYFFVNAS